MKPKIGILALQGCIEPHAKHLEKLGVPYAFVKTKEDLSSVDGLILPGGESTTMIRVAMAFSLWDDLAKRAEAIPYWGICAGSILMAKEVQNPAQISLNTMDLVVKRNAYGRQLDSFQGVVEMEKGNGEAVFIRAPKFVSWGKGVKVSGKVQGEAVFLEEGRHMVTAFHPELTENSFFHQHFLEKVSQ